MTTDLIRPEIQRKGRFYALPKNVFFYQKYHKSWRYHRHQNVEWVMGEWVIPLRLLRLIEHLAVLKKTIWGGIKIVYNSADESK